MESQSSLKKSIKEGGICVGPVKYLLVGDMFRPSFKDVDHVLYGL